ncbi:hypothetical protein Cgig2_025924 [Carnegiea gigantea]|uniref:PUM-HD domain-containing protein n=1 Tax=Carnegiea gigantea TaxID=171969 RepID=A0A9Q1JZK8_9CARY|nr:hypothetical protein Cgig2_025924 [Carnegiea gigantea]
MKGERELDNFLGESPHLTSNNNHHYHQQMLKGAVAASSCSSTSGFCFSDVGSSSIPPFDHSQSLSPKTHFVDQFQVSSSLPDSSWYGNGKVNNGVVLDEVGLAREFHMMNIGNGNRHEFSSDMGRFGRDPDGFRITDCNVPKIRPSNGQNFGSAEPSINGFSGNGGFLSSPLYRDERNIRDEISFRMGQRGDNMGDSLESFAAQNQSTVPYSGGHGNRNCSINFPFEETSLRRDDPYGNILPIPGGNKCYDDGTLISTRNGHLGNEVPVLRVPEHTGNGGLIQRGDGGYGHLVPFQIQSIYGPHVIGDPLQHCMIDGCKEVLNPWACSQNLPLYRPYSDEALLQHRGLHFSGNMGSLNTMDTSQLLHFRQALSRGNKLYNSVRERIRAAEERESAQSVALMKKGRQLDAYGCESTFMVKEKGMSGAIGKSCQSTGRVKASLAGATLQKIGDRNMELNAHVQSERTCVNGTQLMSCDPVILQSIYNSMAEVQGNIYLMAKDQHGCRFLQKKFDKGSFDDVQLIFNEIIDHVVELMMNPFGNYLIQKLLDVCNEEQRMRIVHAVTRDRGELVRICLNTHGTRVVQKLIESLKTKKQISMVVRALEPGFLDLIKDLNGNHVVQRCLQCLSSEDNKFIFDAAAKFCVEIATHRHGCCVLQRCIAHSSGEHQKKLVEEICANGLHLGQDPFGNYVVQYIIELKIPAASAQLTSQFEGHYVHLATQKFSSHVVEKCLKFIEDSRPRIVYELLSVSHFEQLLQDPYANYVIQSALEVTKGALNDSLVAAVRPHSILRTNPYCKKIFSRGMLKK